MSAEALDSSFCLPIGKAKVFILFFEINFTLLAAKFLSFVSDL